MPGSRGVKEPFPDCPAYLRFSNLHPYAAAPAPQSPACGVVEAAYLLLCDPCWFSAKGLPLPLMSAETRES